MDDERTKALENLVKSHSIREHTAAQDTGGNARIPEMLFRLAAARPGDKHYFPPAVLHGSGHGGGHACGSIKLEGVYYVEKP